MAGMGWAISSGWMDSPVNLLAEDNCRLDWKWWRGGSSSSRGDHVRKLQYMTEDRVEKTDEGSWDLPTPWSPVIGPTFWWGWPHDQDIMLMWWWQMFSSVQHSWKCWLCAASLTFLYWWNLRAVRETDQRGNMWQNLDSGNNLFSLLNIHFMFFNN